MATNTKVKTSAVDGLDGSGKGALSHEVAKLLPGHTLSVDYPQYELPWGKVLKHLLYEDDEGLSIEDRMLVYALNRLETVDAIQAQTAELLAKGEQVNIVFDRFFSSNIITAAYYYHKMPPEQRPSDLRTWILGLYKYMNKIDALFLDELDLRGTIIYIPMLQEEDSIAALLADESRAGADSYETSDVQSLARELYAIVAAEYPHEIHLFSQYRDGIRMSPTEQALYILQIQGETPSQGTVHSFRHAVVGNTQRLTDIIEDFGSEKLKALNPYSQT